MKKSAVFGMLFTLIAGMAGGVALGIQIERGQAQPPETVSALSSPEPVSAVSVVSADTEQAVMLEVPYIGQQGLLPTGCEIVSACMVLRYYGCDITVHTLADRYLESAALPAAVTRASGRIPPSALSAALMRRAATAAMRR